MKLTRREQNALDTHERVLLGLLPLEFTPAHLAEIDRKLETLRLELLARRNDDVPRRTTSHSR